MAYIFLVVSQPPDNQSYGTGCQSTTGNPSGGTGCQQSTPWQPVLWDGLSVNHLATSPLGRVVSSHPPDNPSSGKLFV